MNKKYDHYDDPLVGNWVVDADQAARVVSLINEASQHEQVCKNCRFFDLVGTSGMCRRYAPSPGRAMANELLADWPVVELDDWCGEFSK